ncbi:uncharacterized protein V6R79_001422 [Siganus canaliculatus]
MHVSRIWHGLCMLGFLGTSLCVNELEDEGNYVDDYDNEIAQDQQGGETPTPPCQTVDLSRWDRLFIALEDSHMRQNMLQESMEQCCGGVASLRTHVNMVAKGTWQQCLPSLESACRSQTEQVRLRLQQGLVELREEEAKREKRLNATMLQLLHSIHEGNARLKRLEEGRGHRLVPSVGSEGRTGHQPTQRPGGLDRVFGLDPKPFPSVLKEQEVTSPLDMATMVKTLVSIETELQKVHLQLSRVIEQAGTSRKDRGDT